MSRKRTALMISVYIPEKAQKLRVIERLRALAKRRDRSLNYLVVDAIIRYLDREEAG